MSADKGGRSFGESSVDHIGIAVRSLDEARPIYETLAGIAATSPYDLPEQGVRVLFVGQVELIEPTTEESSVARFLAKRGPGLHHLAYAVPDLTSALDRARADGFEVVDPGSRPGAYGHLVAFLHPCTTGGSLIELVQRRSAS